MEAIMEMHGDVAIGETEMGRGRGHFESLPSLRVQECLSALVIAFSELLSSSVHADPPPVNRVSSGENSTQALPSEVQEGEYLDTVERFIAPNSGLEVQRLRELVALLENPQFRIREDAMRDLTTHLSTILSKVNPFPEPLKAEIIPKRKRHKPEQYIRLQEVLQKSKTLQENAFGPTRVPIGQNDSAQDVLKTLERHSGMRLHFPDANTFSSLSSVHLSPNRNTFPEIVQEICRKSNTFPKLSDQEHFLLEFVPQRKVRKEIIIDESGLLLGIFSHANSNGSVSTPQHLDLLSDPNRAFISLLEAKTDGMEPLRVHLQCTVHPGWMWMGKSEGGMPLRECFCEHRPRKPDEKSDPLVTLRIGMLGGKEEWKVGVEESVLSKAHAIPIYVNGEKSEGEQTIRVYFEPEKEETVVHIMHPEDDSPAHYWTEALGLTQRYQLLDEGERVIPSSTVSCIAIVSTPPIFEIRFKSNKRPHAVRISGYTCKDDFQRSIQEFQMCLPRLLQ